MRPLLARVLGEDAFALLPAAVRRLHEGGSFEGEAPVQGPEGVLARFAAWVVGFPAGSARVPVRVVITPDGEGETWERDFGGRRFRSRMVPVAAGLEERFGPIGFVVAVPAEGTGLRVMVRGWKCLGIPVPLFLAPLGDAVESEDEAGRFRFDVAVRLPLGLGRVVHYRGWLVPN
ncbi:DUF4166 domain-containing protein [Falsiroseomonas sp.]|uniref:DUF4166 domain-containing protein n=1 Tax=Falsiroseomonas sp. TaxID=2870721 RepID=UPI003F722438